MSFRMSAIWARAWEISMSTVENSITASMFPFKYRFLVSSGIWESTCWISSFVEGRAPLL